MSLKKVSAIMHWDRLDRVEHVLEVHGVSGFSVHEVKGRGSYFNAYSRNGLTSHAWLDIYTTEDKAPAIAELIIDSACMNVEDEGLVSIQSVDELYWIHSRRCCCEEDFGLRGLEDGQDAGRP